MTSFDERYARYLACGPVANWHEHVWPNGAGELDVPLLDEMLAWADVFRFEKLMVSCPVISRHCTTGEMRHHNDMVYQAVCRHPGRLYGMCYLDPGLTAEAPAELVRCLDELGFVGIKLYNQYTLDDPVQDALIRLCAQRGKPVLMHAAKLNMFADGQPFASNGVHFANAAQKHPNAAFILAHIGGGGDWTWQVKAVAPCPNVLVDISGSIHDSGMVEYAVARLGADRVLFGTDGAFASCVGKLCSAQLTQREKAIILAGPQLANLLH